MTSRHVKIVSEADTDYFEKQYQKALDELGSKVKNVTFSTAAAQAEDNAQKV